LTQYTTDDDSNKYYCHDEVSRHLKNLTEDDWKRIDKELTKFESDHGEFFEKYAKDPFSYFDKAWKSLESGTLRWPRSYDFFTFLFYRPKGGKGVRGVILKYFSDDIKRVGTTDHNLSELWKPNPEDGKAFYDHEKRKKSRDNINEKDYERYKSGEIKYGVFSKLITNNFLVSLYKAIKSDEKTFVFSGSYHNDINPIAIDQSFGDEMAEMIGKKYIEIDIIMPDLEFITNSSLYSKYSAMAPESGVRVVSDVNCPQHLYIIFAKHK